MGKRIILRNKEDFKWHKAKLDLENKYDHDHYGEPEKYPCMVISNWFDNPNGPYTYEHKFIYQHKVICENCGHEKMAWKTDDEGIIYDDNEE